MAVQTVKVATRKQVAMIADIFGYDMNNPEHFQKIGEGLNKLGYAVADARDALNDVLKLRGAQAIDVFGRTLTDDILASKGWAVEVRYSRPRGK